MAPVIDVRSASRDAFNRWQRFWLDAADPRAYALVRIAVGLSFFATLYHLWPLRSELLGPNGLLDPSVVAETNPSDLQYSIFYLVRSEASLTAVFVVAFLACGLMIAGAFSRWPIVFLWVFAVSIDTRAHMMTSGGDQLLRLFLFLLMISPTTAVWSADAWWRGRRKTAPEEPGPVLRYGLRLMQLQVFVVYYQTMWLKLPDAYWRKGELISYFMMSMYSRFPSAAWAEWELLSSVLTYSTMLIELAVPWLLWSRRYRLVGFVLGWGLHASIAVLSIVPLFSMAIMSTYFAYLERPDFERLKSWVGQLFPAPCG